ncbi:MAG: transcriptional repressor LexA [Acidiferrobacterales bacterium]
MLTDRQRQVYDFIGAYQRRCGVSPKLREIAQHLGISSRGSVHRHVRSLAVAGLISIEPDCARGIRIVAGESSGVRDGRLPLLGRIAAGRPLEAIAGQDTIDLSEFFVAPGRFVLRVQGDSMVEAGILDGDMVVVQHTESAPDGEIVVALIDGVEATLKRLKRNCDGTITLQPENGLMAPMRYAGARVQIQGVVVGQFRSYR